MGMMRNAGEKGSTEGHHTGVAPNRRENVTANSAIDDLLTRCLPKSVRRAEPCAIISSPCVDARRATQLAFDVHTLMKIHEYQAKAILSRYGVPVPRGEVAFNASEAGEIARRLGGHVVVVKAEIHAGGRGKGGGVKLARSAEEVGRLAAGVLGMTLVTQQTGPEGRV